MPCCNNNKRTWRFDNSEQTTASNTIREIAGFVGNLFMSFKNVVMEGYVLGVTTQPIVVVSPSGLTVGFVDTDNDFLTVIIPITVSVVGSFQFIVTANDSQTNTIIRRSNLVIESLTGT